MVHIPFDTRTVSYEEHFFQFGGGSVDSQGLLSEPYHYFHGLAPYQRGYGRQQIGGGIGDVLRSVWRVLLPVIRRVAPVISREALSTGQRIIDKVEQGENLKEAVINEGKQGINTLLEKALPKQTGSGAIKRKKKEPIPFHHTIVGRAITTKKLPKPLIKRKRQRIDTFGLY